MYGWIGTLLQVDLSQESVTKEALSPDFARSFLGGMGFALKRIFDELDPQGLREDPFGPQNLVCVIPWTFCGTLVPGSSRLQVAVSMNTCTGVYQDGN
ncbi:MAG: aldehyde ferredoxin oxidoreductase, partial [Candidatus Tectomicrobia bacterium]|nr:aldehyde ferredoxin oxidoreductase [Candidatus Tectomicrobia bacterium]